MDKIVRTSGASVQERLEPDKKRAQLEWRPGIWFVPDFVRATWGLNGAGWDLRDITISGDRVLKPGDSGKRHVDRRWSLPHRAEHEIPEWARQWISDNAPDQTPWGGR